MKKNLLYSLVAAGTLLVGGLTAYAVSETVQLTPRQATLDGAGWIITPENGGSTATLPQITSKGVAEFSFVIDGIEVDQTYKDKVSVKYGGKELEYNRFIFSEDPEDHYGWTIGTTDDFNGCVIRVHQEEVKNPGTIEITLQEGAFDTYDGDLSPAVSYTHTFGNGSIPDTPVEVVVKNCKPEEEATVKTLGKVTLRFDITKLGDNQVFCDDSKVDQITLAKAGVAEPIKATAVAYDESWEAYEEDTMPYTITFPETTEAGEYTMTVPAGFFWAAAEGGEKPADASTNDEITVKYTVDPNAKTGMQIYSIYTPDPSLETVSQLEYVSIVFPEVNMIQFAEEPQLGIKKDGIDLEGVTCDLSYDWAEGTMNYAKVSFLKDNEPYIITQEGSYKITIGAGSIFSGDDLCEEIIETFVVKKETKTYTWTATPENNGKIDLPAQEGYTSFTFKINGAEEVSYDEWEDPDHDPVYGTKTKTIQVTYNGESVKNVANVAAGGDENIGYSLRSNWDEPEIIIGVSNKVFTKGGVLKVTIDEGRCTADGNYPTPAINYTCQVGEIQVTKDYDVTVSPKMNIDEEYLIDYFRDGFKIEFTNAETVVPNMVNDLDDNDQPIMVMAKPPHLAIGSAIYYGDVKVDEVKDAACPTFIVTFPDMFDYDTTLGGSVNFSVDEGTFTVDGEFDSPAISQTWNLKRTKEVNTHYIFGPEGDIVNEGYGIFAAISFDGDELVSLDNTENVVVKLNGEVLPKSEYTLSVINDANKCIYFELMNDRFKDNTLTGTLSVSIPDQAVSVSGVKIGAIEHTWNIVLPKDFNYAVKGFASKYLAGPTYDYKNPALTTELPECGDLSEIIFEIPNAKTAKLWNVNYINLRSRDYFSYGAHVPEVEEVAGAEYPTFKFKFAEAPEAETIYELSFNYGAFYVDNAYDTPNLEFAVVFNKESGVAEIIGSTAEGYTVVTMDGKVVFTNGTFDQVKALDKGIYIINGKKVAVR